MLYELMTLDYRLGTLPKLNAGIQAAMLGTEATGQLLGCWTSDIGQLNQMTILRAFDDAVTLEASRRRLMDDANPFGCGEAIARMNMESYAAFPWVAPVTPGKFGAVYEIRTYMLKHGGVEPSSKAWEAAVPARVKLSPMTVLMYALDGAPRITHIWPYASLDARATIRAKSVADGIWPPKGGPDWLTGDMRSYIALPTAFSPLA